MPIVTMPDGTNVQFPDEMPKEQIRDLIASKFPEAGVNSGRDDLPLSQAGMPSVNPNAPGANGYSPANFGSNNARGMVSPGNTDLSQRPIVKNPDGSISTVRSMSFQNNNGQEVLIPTVADDGSRVLSDQEAMEQYGRTRKHLGIFSNPEDATAYAESLHNDQEKLYQPRASLSDLTTRFQNAQQEDTDRLIRANMEARKINELQGDEGLLRRAADAIPGGATGGFADEIYSGTLGAASRMLRDGVGYGEAYDREQALQAALKRNRGDGANIIGDVAGGLGLGGTMAKGGLTLMGRASSGLGKTAAGVGEGAAYGGFYGAGNADAGDRLEEAAKGAAIGGLTGGFLEAGGNAISRLRAPKAIPAPATDELASASTALYDRARQANVAIKPESFDKLAANVQLMAGRLNKDLRPNTSGIVEDVMALRGKPIDLQEFDELRQTVGMAMKRAQPQDVRTLSRIQKTMDHFADNIGAREVTGDPRAFGVIKDARKLYSQKMKAQKIEDLLDLADVDTGRYTQSGMANTIRQRMSNLYKEIKKGTDKSWTAEEVKLIRQMAKGGSQSQMVNWLAKLAPRGAVSIMSSMGTAGLGGAAAGPMGMLAGVPVAAGGFLAGRAADRGAMSAANTLRDAAARGHVLPQIQLPNYLRPAIGGATAGAIGLQR